MNIFTIKTGEIMVDSGYCKKSNPKLVDRLVENWRDDISAPLLVADRSNDDYYVIDGQHRLEAMKRMGVETVLCKAVKVLSLEDEKRLFTLTHVGLKDSLKVRIV